MVNYSESAHGPHMNILRLHSFNNLISIMIRKWLKSKLPLLCNFHENGPFFLLASTHETSCQFFTRMHNSLILGLTELLDAVLRLSSTFLGTHSFTRKTEAKIFFLPRKESSLEVSYYISHKTVRNRLNRLVSFDSWEIHCQLPGPWHEASSNLQCTMTVLEINTFR